MLDPTQERIIGVLIEKELSVPDTYPLTENSLLAGCNQKNNRDPEMSLEPFQISGALLALREQGWVVRVEGGRAIHYRHEARKMLELGDAQLPIVAELLLRGAQTPAALKTRVARMGLDTSPEAIRAELESLARRARPLVEELELQPRERDRRWRHLIGAPREGGTLPAGGQPPQRRPLPGASASTSTGSLTPGPQATARAAFDVSPAPGAGYARNAQPAAGAAAVDAGLSGAGLEELARRVAALERQVAELRVRLDAAGN